MEIYSMIPNCNSIILTVSLLLPLLKEKDTVTIQIKLLKVSLCWKWNIGICKLFLEIYKFYIPFHLIPSLTSHCITSSQVRPSSPSSSQAINASFSILTKSQHPPKFALSSCLFLLLPIVGTQTLNRPHLRPAK